MPVLGGSVARSIARFSRSAAKVSLPGLAELEDVATALIKNWKTADRNDSEFSGLATRVEGICSLLHEVDVMEHTGVSEALRRLYEIKGILAEELKRRSRLGVLGTEQKQRLLDSLRSEVDRIVEVTHLRLTIMQAQYHRHNPIDNFQVISAHDIIDRSVVYERNYYLASEDTNQPAIKHTAHTLTVAMPLRCDCSYSLSRQQSQADNYRRKAIETELKCLSRCLHPNVASVMGITKGYDGVSGYVLATDGMPLNQFMRHVDSGASLVKCIQGYEHAIVAVREVSQRFSVIHSDVTVQPNGHLVASPALYNSGYYPLGPSYGKTSHPATLLVLGIHNINNNTRPPHPELANFLDDISVLGRQTFTVLEVARLAAKYKALPGRRMHSWDDEASAPPFTINAEDTGYTSQQFPRSFWTPGKPRQVGLDGDDVVGFIDLSTWSGCSRESLIDR
ncbi:hypothetical protein FRC09_009921 [Ceratobasidium sp. 395]|nr:hypothetical protein FRC09_009921 [Ceratobasidium sp. 395]